MRTREPLLPDSGPSRTGPGRGPPLSERQVFGREFMEIAATLGGNDLFRRTLFPRTDGASQLAHLRRAEPVAWLLIESGIDIRCTGTNVFRALP